MATAFSFAQTILFSKTSVSIRTNGLRSFTFCLPFSSSSAASLSSDKLQSKKWRQPVASVLELGGVKISKDDVLRDDPTNNVPDTIFAKLGMQLHRRDQHPIGILKNAIYEFFDTNCSNQFDNLCPIVSGKENFDDVLVPADHVSRSYNDTLCGCSNRFEVSYKCSSGRTIEKRTLSFPCNRRCFDSIHYPVFHQMEGVRVFSPLDWEASGTDGTTFVAGDLKNCLEGLARHLFGAVEMRWVDTYFPFTNPSFELEIFFQFSSGQLGVKFKPFSKCPSCYKDVSFWINEALTENNLCEVVREVAGDLAEEVQLIDNFTNKKGMTSHCYRIAYRSMERSLTDEEINKLQWNVRELVQSKLNVVLR